MMTPLMSQYNAIKRQYKNAVLLFRMGDFYETFGNDAILVSKILEITLTSRDKNKDNTALAGFPYHALDTYLPRLVEKGYTVAIAEQVEDPALAKGIVKRKVTRVITPGTILDSQLLNSNKNNFLVALRFDKGNFGLAVTDISTGDISCTILRTAKELLTELERIAPSEIIVCPNNIPEDLSSYIVHPFELKTIGEEEISALIMSHYNVHNWGGIGFQRDDLYVQVLLLLFGYIVETQFEIPKHIKNPRKYDIYDSMILDNVAIRSLNIVGPRENDVDLFSILNRTQTAMGARLLFNLVTHPHINREQIIEKSEHVQFYINDGNKYNEVRRNLKGVADVERIIGKLGVGRCIPRDLLAIKDSMQKFVSLLNDNLTLKWKPTSDELVQINDLIANIDKTIRENPSNDLSLGGYIKVGFSEEFDSAFALVNNGERLLKELEERFIKETNIPTIKVKRNKIWGFYIEITNRYKNSIPTSFIHRQTLVNASRFTTPELVELERKIIQEENNIINLELSIYNELVELIRKKIFLLQNITTELAYVDLISNFAYISELRGYTKPKVLSISDRKINIKNGRHPIVSEVLKETFIPNSTTLDEKSFVHIITGPNMSGKSTYLRQVALIILMAQIGCFVPAESCEFSVCDRVFTRIGASDDISSGRSTFMVEMSEMSNILKNASRNSLVLLDEIGRGTSTYDGVSLAWAIAKHIAEKVGAFTLFATHYHELIQLKNYTSGIENFTVSVLESDDKKEVTFLYKIEEGETDKSYGVYVAKIAGIPDEILNEAEQILSGFEQKRLFSKHPEKKEIVSNIKPMTLFAELKDPKMDMIKEKLKDLNIDEITPLQALSLLAEIVKINKNS